MDQARKKAAAAAFRERKPVAGVFAIRCLATGEVWIGRTPNLAAIWTRIAFSLRQDASPNAGLQAAWREHGAESFVFEAVETLKEEALDFARDSLLKERLAHWRAALGARPL
jgi:hypothetical protein